MKQYRDLNREMEARDHFKNGTKSKNQMKKFCVIFLLMFMGGQMYGQNEQQVYLGLGAGLDYGGILGGKIEYLPIKNLGLYGGLGYNLLSLGWNVGATYKILPEKKVSPNLMLFYGYNAVSQVKGAPEYEMTSYGVTVGANLDIKLGAKGNKLSVGLFVPIRTQKFMDNYDAMKKDPRVEMKSDLLPIAVSVGFNWVIK